MRGWRLTRRGDYINSELANRTRPAVVSLERSSLWSFVVRTLQGQEKRRGRNYPTAAAAMQAAEEAATAANANKEISAQVTDYLGAKQRGEKRAQARLR
ncbi:MAG: hypothetical protein F4047_07345 [Caldilineaceae bacterium SB0670_bin_27]|uniref:Uncharacterized protein n=1 Tax=Caldilineaceae bacterium SB0664_bin_27 TaxID=2605260 RepID=A0A6B0YXV0_9CHLR|nr:hypothetical protein [Caldilineaceae bacterium SB0664_bin_27]MYJ77952.1 hypothetical protein [Caldilineaceae bacterium SB0670_bin_27]